MHHAIGHRFGPKRAHDLVDPTPNGRRPLRQQCHDPTALFIGVCLLGLSCQVKTCCERPDKNRSSCMNFDIEEFFFCQLFGMFRPENSANAGQRQGIAATLPLNTYPLN
jgi:hypothetical protein